MLISEIKNKEVRELAEYYAREMPSSTCGRGKKDVLIESFCWDDTQEGYDFWDYVDEGCDLELPKKTRATFDMPRLPIGWRYTNEFRKSVEGVDYIYCDGKVVLSRGQEMEYPIVVRIAE